MRLLPQSKQAIFDKDDNPAYRCRVRTDKSAQYKESMGGGAIRFQAVLQVCDRLARQGFASMWAVRALAQRFRGQPLQGRVQCTSGSHIRRREVMRRNYLEDLANFAENKHHSSGRRLHNAFRNVWPRNVWIGNVWLQWGPQLMTSRPVKSNRVKEEQG